MLKLQLVDLSDELTVAQFKEARVFYQIGYSESVSSFSLPR